ncbi:MAG: condensation domain-containing protein [Phycisphaerales bacterium]|nr:condensation domain-containing protein [Phycisphaerales bacterium]
MTTTNEASGRPLSYFESTMQLATERYYSATICCWAMGTGPVDIDQVRSALQVLHARHPLLRARIEGEPGTYRFLIDVPFGNIPVHEITLAEGEDINSVLEPLMDEHFPSGQRTWGARFVRSGTSGRWWLLLQTHHAITDGRSAYCLLDQCGQLLGAMASGDPIDPAPLELPEPIEHQMDPPGTLEHWNRTGERWSDRIGTISHWPADGAADFEDRHCHNTFSDHDPDFSRRLLDRCHAAGTTVQGALASAVARGIAAYLDHAIDIDTFTPVDLRRFAAVDIDPHEIACKITCLDTGSFNISSESDPWDVARNYTSALNRQLDEKPYPPADFRSKDVIAGSTGFLGTGNRFGHGFCLTNTGRLHMDGDYGPIQFELVDVTATVRFGGFPVIQSVYTFRDRLRCTYTWPEPLLSRPHALELTREVESHLQSMVD